MTNWLEFHDFDADRDLEADGCDFEADGWAESAAWIRAAGGYLEVSQDLRPATLEAARAVLYEKRIGGGLLVAALIALLLTVPTTPEHPALRNPMAFGNPVAIGSPEAINHSRAGKNSRADQLAPRASQLGFASSYELFRFVGSRNAEVDSNLEVGWSWVEAFQMVHRQRSAALGGG